MRFMRYLLIIIILFGLFLTPSVVGAAESLSNLTVDVITDKQEYSVDEEIHYQITIGNESEIEGKDIVVTSILPADLEVINSSSKIDGNKLIWNLSSLGKGEVEVLNFEAKLKEERSEVPAIGANVSEGQNPPQTGDGTNIVFYIVLLISAVIATTLVIRQLRKNRLRKEMTLLLILGLLVPAMGVANAEEIKGKIEEVHKISIDGKEYEVVTSVETKISEEEPQSDKE